MLETGAMIPGGTAGVVQVYNRSMRVLAFDFGSSSARAALFNRQGNRIPGTLIARRYSIRSTSDGGAELDPEALLIAARRCFRRFRGEKFDTVAASGFWHGLLGIGTAGRAITPIYTWGDSRSRNEATEIRSAFREKTLLQRTGCMLRFPFWPAKLSWLRRTKRRLFDQVRYWVSPGDWLFMQLFGELATSESMASGTGLFDRSARSWDRELCDWLKLDTGRLPPIQDGLRHHTVFTPIGDGAASNLGSGADTESMAAINLGTSAAVRVLLRRNARLKIPFGLFRYVVNAQTDVLGGAISNAGNLREWCCREFHFAKAPELSRSVAAANPLVTLPYLIAERAPDWVELPALVFGITKATTAADIFAALTTSSFYRLAEALDLIKSAMPVSKLIVSGGFQRSAGALQVLADVLGQNLEIASDAEASLRGSAVHALRTMGEHPSSPTSRRLVRHRATWSKHHHARRQKQRHLEAIVSRAFAR